MENSAGKSAPDPNFVPNSEHSSTGYTIKKVENAQIKTWLVKGWSDFSANPPASLAYGAIVAFMGVMMSIMAFKSPTFLVAASTGFLIVGQFLALGLYDLSRQREQGQTPNLVQSLTSIKRNGRELGLYALALGGLMTLWIIISAIIIGFAFDTSAITQGFGYFGLLKGLLSSSNGWLFTLLFLAIGLGFLLITFITGVVTAPLLLDRKVDLVTAVKTSIHAFQKNPVTLLLWGITIAVIIQLGLMSYNIGLIMFMPIVSHASWHAYRDLVVMPNAK